MRIVSNIDKKPGPLPYCPKPNAVYLGTNFEENNIKQVMKIAERRNFDVYQMKKTLDYGLEAERLQTFDENL